MALQLVKNQKQGLSLVKPVDTVSVKLNWDSNGLDLDLLVIGRRKGQQPHEEDVLYWGTEQRNAQGKQHIGNDSAVFITGDNRTGDGDDDEVMVFKAKGSQYDELEVYVYVYPPDDNTMATLDEAKNAKLEFFLNNSSTPSHFFDFSDDKYFGVKGILAGVVTVEKDGYPEFEGKNLEYDNGLESIFRHYGFI